MWDAINRFKSPKRRPYLTWVGSRKVTFMDQQSDREIRDPSWKNREASSGGGELLVKLGCTYKPVSCWGKGHDRRPLGFFSRTTSGNSIHCPPVAKGSTWPPRN